LHKAPKKGRNALIDAATAKQIGSIRNVCHCIVTKQLPLGMKQRRRLRKYWRHMRDLGDNTKLQSLESSKKRLKLVGGALLPLIIPAVLSLLSGLASKGIAKAAGI
jgi:hypothetical protein